jgi:streptogramin lyase
MLLPWLFRRRTPRAVAVRSNARHYRPRVEILESRLAPAMITEFGGLSSASLGIVAGPDGNLWFTERDANKIGQMSTAGVLLNEYTIPTANSSTNNITVGPDGNLWFTEETANQIGRITPSGAITEFSASITLNAFPTGITAGPDGNLWFTEENANRIGRITPTGVVTEFAIPTANSTAFRITVGPDGNLWFTEVFGNQIGRITPFGKITEFAVATAGSQLRDITAGSDGNLWFTEENGNQIGRITPSGTVTEFAVPTAASDPRGIAAGPDGNLWFVEFNGNQVGRITPTGVVTEYTGLTSQPDAIAFGPDGNLWFTEVAGKIGRLTPPAPIVEFGPATSGFDIARGPDGNLWFTDNTPNQIGRITPSGTITEFTVPTQNSLPTGITAGPDGNLWFTEQSANKIGRITTSGTFLTEFSSGPAPFGITTGADGNLWFAETSGAIGRMTPSGSLTEFPIATPSSFPLFIALGPDGNLWFTEELAGKIGRITTTGVITEFTVPTPNSQPRNITAGPDGNVWFSETGVNQIGRITPTGTFTEFVIPTGGAPRGITAAPDGNLWFTDDVGNNIGRITTAGIINEYTIPTSTTTRSMTVGPDGNLWFVEQSAGQIGRLSLLVPQPGSLPVAAVNNGYAQTFTAGGGTGLGYHYSEIGALPPGMKFTRAGELSGTPTVAGTYQFLLTAIDSLGQGGSQLVTLTVSPPITIKPGILPDRIQGASFGQALAGAGGSGAGYSFSATSPLPPGITLTSAGVLGGTPSAAGAFTFTVEATDSNGASGSQSFILTVLPSFADSFTRPFGTMVSLSSFFNRIGIVSDGSTFGGGLDGLGFAYSANLLGSSVTFNGDSFDLGAANTGNVVSAAGQVINLPSGTFSALNFLATGVQGNQAGSFIVTYTDNSMVTFNQSLSDWFAPQNFSGESKVVTTAYRDAADGNPQNGPFYLYGYSFALNTGKTVKSITLPSNGNIEILAMTLTPSPAGPPVSLGNNWVEVPNVNDTVSPEFTISGNVAIPHNSGPNTLNAAIVNDFTPADVSVSAQVTISASSSFSYGGVMARLNNGNTQAYVGVLANVLGQHRALLGLLQGTAIHFFGSVSLGSTTSGTLTLNVFGSNLSLFLGNTLLASATDTTLIAAGGVGIVDENAVSTLQTFQAITGVSFTDTFQRLSAPPTSLGSAYSQDINGGFTINASGQAIEANVPGLSVSSLVGVDVTSADVMATIVSLPPAGTSAGVVADWNAATQSGYELVLVHQLVLGTSLQLAKIVNGVATTLVSVLPANLPPLGISPTVELQANGSNLTAYVNGVFLFTFTDTISPFSSGSVGLAGSNGGALSSFSVTGP